MKKRQGEALPGVTTAATLPLLIFSDSAVGMETASEVSPANI